MRILYFSRDYTTHDHRFLASISERHEVFFLRLEADGIAYEKRPVPDGVKVVAWAGGRNRFAAPESWLRLMPAYQRVIEEIRPDLVHAGPVQSCGFMSALSGFHPLLLMSWGSDMLIDSDRDEFWRWMTYQTLSRADLFACDSDEVSRRARALVGYPQDRIVQFPWGVDVSAFSPGEDRLRLRNRLGWQDCFLIISTRALEPNYGVDIVLEAFSRALHRDPKVRLVLAGDGSQAEQIRCCANDLNLSSFVYFAGMISQAEMPSYLRAADLYVSCAYSDGSSVSLLEAMACGLPVVVTDRPSNREWVIQGENGWLAKAGSSASFAQALLEAVALGALRRRISSQNRRIIERRADWKRNFDRLLAAYDRLGSAALAVGTANGI